MRTAKNMRVLCISCYPEDDEKANGFMQLVHFLRASSGHDVVYCLVKKLWKIKRYNKLSVTVPVPFFRFSNPLLRAVAKTLTIFPRNSSLFDIVILDSDPYVVSLSQMIKQRFYCSFLIYRQSDPLIFVAKNAWLCEEEKKLMNSADQIWVPNILIKNLLDPSWAEKVRVLGNPIKDVGEPFFDRAIKSGAEKTEFSKYDYTGIYYGKFGIDIELIFRLAIRTPKVKYIIYGDYTCSKGQNCPDNVVFAGFCSLELIMCELKRADFLFLPYLSRGIINRLLFITAKILSAKKYQKPVIAINVAPELKDVGIYVASNEDQFVSFVCQVQELSPPNIDISNYDEKVIFAHALELIEECKLKLNAVEQRKANQS